MAGQIVDVDMADDDLLPPWRTVIELAGSGISKHWTLVGGLMVDAHARRANVVMPRPTEDVDLLVDYATNRSSLIEAQTALRKIGFELSDSERHAYRFTRSDGRKLGRPVELLQKKCAHVSELGGVDAVAETGVDMLTQR